MDLLQALIIVSEKAANIARVCRRDEHLFDLLVQKKKNEDANPRFVEDFKTLADVLIQEMVRNNIAQQFHEIDIYGEEDNVFKNKLGDEICVAVKATQQETSELLETVLNGDRIAADLLAAEVHREIVIDDIDTNVPKEDFYITLDQLGIWIDPIDCTAEYINGVQGCEERNIHLKGLKCVTILIGAFNKRNGSPIMGVINRPFLDENDSSICRKCVWGVSLPNYNINSGLKLEERSRIVCISSSEIDNIKEKLQKKGFHVIAAAGAGYKVLTVILGQADAYVLTQGTTYKWDTCAPHSILKSLGGDIVCYDAALQNEIKSVKYSVDGNNCNSNGIIAFKNREVFNEIVETLK